MDKEHPLLTEDLGAGSPSIILLSINSLLGARRAASQCTWRGVRAHKDALGRPEGFPDLSAGGQGWGRRPGVPPAPQPGRFLEALQHAAAWLGSSTGRL